tara:strand:- start:1339 stop:2331 length:993 start_codon:yes stop_codon:yes gene_type:complete
MIIKSYILENNPQEISNINSILFYGVNLGLRKYFKDTIKLLNKNNLVINLLQDDIQNNNDLISNELGTPSLFQEKKIIIIDQATDKCFSILEQSMEDIKDNQIIIFSENLDKKSKLRNFFEKDNNFAAVACYEDNEISIKKIIMNKLKGFKGLNTININMILDNCGLDRVKLNNELDKILSFFENKVLDEEKLKELLNNKINDDFNLLKNEALSGNRIKTNKLLSETLLEAEKNILYLNLINQRLSRLNEAITNSKNSSLEQALTTLKPPVFWKEKPIFLSQAKKWNSSKINKILNKTYDLEIMIKSNSLISKNILIKKLLLDICESANA